MPLTKEEVAGHIRKAFRGVTLGNGVGLREGQGLDDYADEPTRKEYREQDEKHDWERIPVETLNCCQSSLSFFDGEGMRFHLPAFLTAELNGEMKISTVFHLAYLDDYAKSKFVLLSDEQRKAVCAFLRLVQNLPDYECDGPHIERALSEYWESVENWRDA